MKAFFIILSELITGDLCCPKPDPEGIFKAMEALNTTAVETLVVGDAGADVSPDNALEQRSILARWGGFVPPHDLPSTPDYVFTNDCGRFREFLWNL